MKNVLWTMSVLLLAFPTIAAAQTAGHLPAGGGGGYGGYGGYDGGYHSSTAAEGVQRGFADIVRAKGQNNLDNSEAAINWSVARRNEIDNRLYGTKTYFEMRDANRQSRAAERGPRPSTQDMIRYSRTAAPKRLSVSEFDPLSGAINWPPVLLGEQYKDYRNEIERIYTKRATDGFLNGEQLGQVKSLMTGIGAKLKENVRSYPTNSYTQAKSFLRSLAYESLLPAG